MTRALRSTALFVHLLVACGTTAMSRTIDQSFRDTTLDKHADIAHQMGRGSIAWDADSQLDTTEASRYRVNPRTSPSDSGADGNGRMAKSFLDMERELRSQQARNEILYMVFGSSVVTMALISTDQRTYDALYGWKDRNSMVKSVSPVITYLGSGYFSTAVFGGFLAYGAFANDRGAVRTGKLGLESFLASGIAAQILKHTFGRERPAVATQPGGAWHGPLAHLTESRSGRRGIAHFDAFPSGHTASAFAAATILSDVYETPAVAYISYSLAVAVGISRITEQTHWASDVFVGALVGVFSAKLVESLNADNSPVRVEPFALASNYGLRLVLIY